MLTFRPLIRSESEMMKVLFVCTGNTCRSPMAAAVFNELCCERGIAPTAKSAGLFANGGEKASDNAIAACREKGIDISAHKASRLTLDMLDESDVIVPLAASHEQILRSATGDKYADKICFIPPGVSDPFGGDIEVYRKCLGEIEVLCRKIMEKIEETGRNDKTGKEE